MKIQINMTDSFSDMDRFASGEELLELLEDFDGIELMAFEDKGCGKIPADRVTGIHTCSYPFWYDFWTGDRERCLAELGDEETVRAYYGGTSPDALLEHYRRDILSAGRYGAEYMVFHVSDCTILEAMTGRYHHSDAEVIDAFCGILNSLFPADWDGPEILLENLWEPGFTFLDPEMTERLLDGVNCRKKGIMLDTGHLMNTNTALRTPEEATEYVHRQLDRHGALCRWIRGVHLNQSLSGEYVEYVKQHLPELTGSYNERYGKMFEYVFRADQHRPYLCGGVEALVQRIAPEYLTFEFVTNDLEEHRTFLRQQKEALPGLFAAGKRPDRVAVGIDKRPFS